MFFTNTSMFKKNIRLIEKIIRTFDDKDTVDCLQTIGVCEQSTVCLFYRFPYWFNGMPL